MISTSMFLPSILRKTDAHRRSELYSSLPKSYPPWKGWSLNWSGTSSSFNDADADASIACRSVRFSNRSSHSPSFSCLDWVGLLALKIFLSFSFCFLLLFCFFFPFFLFPFTPLSSSLSPSLSFLPLVSFSPLPPVLLPVPLFSFHSVYLLSIPDVLASSFFSSYAPIVIIDMKTSKGNYFNFN